MKNLIIYLSLLFFASCGLKERQAAETREQKIVCIAKQYTEIIFALGAGDRLSAVDVSSTYPEAARRLPTVGYHRALSVEGILAVKPELILHDNNIGPQHVIEQLEKLKIPMKTFAKYSNTMAGTDSLIREMGSYFGRSSQADSICERLDQDMKEVQKLSPAKTRPKVCIIHYGQASNVYLTMTKKSTAAKLVSWAGGEMTLDGEKGMMPLSAEVVADSDPDVILLTDFGYDRLGDPGKIMDLPGVSGTKAARNGKIYRVEEHDFVYLGPRTGQNILLLRELLFKEINNNEETGW